jgi:hypothetical protein
MKRIKRSIQFRVDGESLGIKKDDYIPGTVRREEFPA